MVEIFLACRVRANFRFVNYSMNFRNFINRDDPTAFKDVVLLYSYIY